MRHNQVAFWLGYPALAILLSVAVFTILTKRTLHVSMPYWWGYALATILVVWVIVRNWPGMETLRPPVIEPATPVTAISSSLQQCS